MALFESQSISNGSGGNYPMIKALLVVLFGMAPMKPIYAEVPSKALTFTTNITVTNATTTMEEKIRKAEELIKRVIATDDFRTQVLNHTYNGSTSYVDTTLTNEQVYQAILDGAERLNKIVDNQMDLDMEMYYEDSTTVGYTSSGSPKIYANTKYYDKYSAATITGNMTHEWLHKLGFTHATTYSASRDHSVPYYVGTIMRTLAANLPADPVLDFFTAPANLVLSTTVTDVLLKWDAATSSNGISSYKIYRRLSGSTTNYLQATTSLLTFGQAKPTKDAAYYVKAVDGAGRELKSGEVNYKVPLTAPTNLLLTKSGANIVLTWTAASAAKEYKIYRRLSGSTTNYLQGTVTGTTFTQSKPTTSAVYYVRSVDASGNTLKSAEVSYTK